MGKSPQINLLSQDDFTTSPLGQTLTWILTTGRWIVVFTELIVILAFLSRFKLDRQLSDLNEEITQKQAIVDSFTNFESQFRHTQKRLQVAQAILAQQPAYPQLLDQITTSLPTDTKAHQIKIEGNRLTLLASSLSNQSIDTAITNLSAIRQLQKVQLSKVSLSTKDVFINFEINALITPP